MPRKALGPLARRLAWLLAAGALALAGSAAPAGATTVGGSSESEAAPFALAGARLLVPTFAAENLGEASPGPPVTEEHTELLSIDTHGSRTLTLDSSTHGKATPAVAVANGRAASAWLGAQGLQSALIAGGQTLEAVASHAAPGVARNYVLAVDPAGARAVMWSEAAGLELQVVPAGGPPSPALALAAGESGQLALCTDGSGGWWALWEASGRLLAAHVQANGPGPASGPGQASGAPPASGASPASGVPPASGPAPASIDLGPAPGAPAGGSSSLYRYTWTAVPDGRGGVWVALARTLLHVAPAGAVSRSDYSHAILLAGGESGGALAEDRGRGTIAVRSLARAGARPVLMRGLGSLVDVAFDTAGGAIDVLAARPHGLVLAALDRSGRPSGRHSVRVCPRRSSGALVANGGLVAVACAGPAFEAENVESGGDFKSGRNIDYYLLRAGRRLHHEGFFEGSYGF